MGGGPGTGTNGRMKMEDVVKVVGRALMRSHLRLQGAGACQPHLHAVPDSTSINYIGHK